MEKKKKIANKETESTHTHKNSLREQEAYLDSGGGDGGSRSNQLRYMFAQFRLTA